MSSQTSERIGVLPNVEHRAIVDLPVTPLRVEVTNTPITLVFSSNEGTQSLFLKEGHLKVGLATFATLTSQEIQGYRYPWIDSDTIVEKADGYLTSEQLLVRVLRPMTRMGALESEGGTDRGQMLRTDPIKLLDALGSTQRTVEIVAEPFESWHAKGVGEGLYPPLVLYRKIMPVLEAVSQVASRADQQALLDMDRVAELANLSIDRTFRNMRDLVIAGLMQQARSGSSYQNSHVLPLLHEIAKAQKLQRDLLIVAPRIPKYKPHTVTREYTAHKPLYEDAEQDYLWVDAGAEVASLGNEILAKHIRRTLELPLLWTTVSTEDYASTVYKGLFPDREDVSRRETLAVLDALGIGPVVLRTLERRSSSSDSLAQRLGYLELYVEESDQEILLSIRAKLLMLADPSVSIEQAFESARDYSVAECLELVDIRESESDETHSNAHQIIFYRTDRKNEGGKPKEDGSTERERITALRKAIGPQFDHEMGSVAAHSSIPAAEMMPVHAIQYHYPLQEAHRVPWTTMASLDLGKINTSRNSGHNLYTRSGALIASLFINEGIKGELRKHVRKEHDAVVLLAQQTAHMLSRRVADTEQFPRIQEYASACLMELINNDKENLVCTCSFCQAVHESLQ